MSKRFQILSLDGGGLKGIFTASLLTAIEKITGKGIVDHFDLITGTSTGGIIALALGAGYHPEEILGFYKDMGKTIFPVMPKSCLPLQFVRAITQRKYSSDPLKKALEKYFGDKCLFQSRVPLIIPSFDPCRGDVYIYKTPHHPRLKCDFKEPLSKIALATASAPTYFEAFVDEVGLRLIDGGIWANNPSMVALTEALGYFSQEQSNIAMLSIGTTCGPVSSNPSQWKGGLWAWRKKAIEFLLHGQMLSAHNQSFHILGEERYLRVNPLISENLPLDKFPETLEGLGHSEARIRINELEKMFLSHIPQDYKPVYGLENIEIGVCNG